MIAAKFMETLNDAWRGVEAVRVGDPNRSAPACCVAVSEDGRPLLRVDICPFGPDAFAFQDAVVWNGSVVIGYGSYVYTVSLGERSTTTISLGSYFGYLHPFDDYLLIASGDRLFRMERDRSIAWKSEHLGIDGVIVRNVEGGIIDGEGEWDPPGGWLPFTIEAANGRIVSAAWRSRGGMRNGT